MADERDPAAAARLFKALADPIRVRLLALERMLRPGGPLREEPAEAERR